MAGLDFPEVACGKSPAGIPVDLSPAWRDFMARVSDANGDLWSSTFRHTCFPVDRPSWDPRADKVVCVLNNVQCLYSSPCRNIMDLEACI